DSSKILITNCNDKAIFSCVLDNQLNVTRSTVIKNKNMEGFYVADAFIDNNGNKYYTYRFTLDNINKRGIVTESYKGGQPKFQEFKIGTPGYDANDLYFGFAKRNSTISIFGNYYQEQLNEGVFLTTI